MQDTAIRIEKLKKKYRSLMCPDDVSLEVGRGQIFGFLGPNGAEKTTAVNILTTLARPDEGRIEVAGTDVSRAALGEPDDLHD